MIDQVCKHLSEGGIIAYPTETLWGLGVDIHNETAVEKLFELKKRQSSKAISVLVRDVVQAHEVAVITPQIERLLYFFWPGPLTVVLEAQSEVSEKITGGSGFVGLRCSPRENLRKLQKRYPSPITTTSANVSGSPAALSKKDLCWLPQEILLYEPDVELQPSEGSTVVKIQGDCVEILREGDLDQKLLKKFSEKISLQFRSSS